jgi:hypothetical protein
MKNIKLTAVVYEMLLELSKKNKQKPEDYIETIIKSSYQARK